MATAALSVWKTARPATADILPGRAYTLALRPSPMPLIKTAGPIPKSDSFRGYIPLRIARPGAYGIALSDRGWIDLTRGKEPALKSASHGHGPACSSIRKIVNFNLRPGTYMLQIAESPVAKVKVLVIQN